MLTLRRIDGEMKNSLKTYIIMEEEKKGMNSGKGPFPATYVGPFHLTPGGLHGEP